MNGKLMIVLAMMMSASVFAQEQSAVDQPVGAAKEVIIGVGDPGTGAAMQMALSSDKPSDEIQWISKSDFIQSCTGGVPTPGQYWEGIIVKAQLRSDGGVDLDFSRNEYLGKKSVKTQSDGCWVDLVDLNTWDLQMVVSAHEISLGNEMVLGKDRPVVIKVAAK